MLADLDVAPLRSLTQAAQDLYILGSRELADAGLLASIAQQLTLAGRGRRAERRRAAERDRPARRARPGRAGRDAGAAPGREIDDRYKALRDLMRPGALDQVLKPLVDLQQQLAKMAASANRAGATTDAGSADPAVALRTEALRQPQPLRAG